MTATQSLETQTRCYVPVVRGDGFSLGIAVAGESGYYATDYHSVPTYAEARKWADLCNEEMGVSKERATEIHVASMR